MNLRSGLFFRITGMATLFVLLTAVCWAETKLDYRQRQAVQRQEWNMNDVDKKIAAGTSGQETEWVLKKLDSIIADLDKNKCPDDNSQVASLKERVAKARQALGSTAAPKAVKSATTGETVAQATAVPVPKLPPSARQAVGRQWSKVKQNIKVLQQLWDDVEKATTLKKWDGRNIAFSLQGVQDDLDKNNVPPNHPHYKKIMATKAKILASLEELKTIAQPKIDAHANATNLANYPEVQEDIQRADDLAHLYQNVGISNLKNPDKAAKLLGPAAAIESFIADSRNKYAPLIENKLGPGNSLETKLEWLAKNFKKFKKVQQDFNEQAPGEIRSMLTRAEGVMSQAVDRKTPQMFTGGVSQSMENARGMLQSLSLSMGQDSPVVAELTQAITASQKKSDETAKALEEEILAETKTPEDKYEGSDGAELKQKIRVAWQKENPDDEIMDVRILTPIWERTISWNYNAAGVWYKSDKEFLGFIVIVKTDEKIATLYPAFINRDNLKKRESTVTSHKSTYVIRRMLVKNVK